MEIPTNIYDESLDEHREYYRPVSLTLRILIESYWRFGATCYLYIESRNIRQHFLPISVTLLTTEQTKRRPLHLQPQSVPRSKHFSSRL